jgi:hypothetical protein
MGTWHDAQNWYGGQIEHRGKLQAKPDGTYKIVLHSAVLNKRSRPLARYVGSRALLIISLDDINKYDDKSMQNARSFLQRRLNVCGRAFVFFHNKENTAAWFLEATEPFDPNVLVDECDRVRRSYEQVLEWCLAPSATINLKQVCTSFIANLEQRLI